MGNGDGGTCGHQPFQGILHQAFAFGVEGTGGLVKDEDGWILQYGPCYGDALSLSARESATAVAHHRVVAVLHLHDEVVGVGYACRLFYLLLRCALLSEGDVVADGIVEEDGLLIDVADEATQRTDAQLADVLSVNLYLAFRYVVVTWDKIDQGALSRPRLAHEGECLSLLHREVDVVQNLAAFAVAETYVLQHDFVLQTLDGLGVFRFTDIVLCIQDSVDTLHRSQPFLYGISCLRQVLDGLQRGIEDDEVVDELVGIYRAVAVEDEPTAEPQHEDYHHRTEELADGVCGTLADGHTTGYVAVFVGHTFEAVNHLVLSNKCLDDTQPAQCLLYLAHAVGELGLHGERTRFQFFPDSPDTESHQGHHEQGEERQLPADDDKCSDIYCDEYGVLHYHVERGCDAGIDLVHVGCDARHDVALSFLAEEGERQAHNLAVDVVADVADDACAQGC